MRVPSLPKDFMPAQLTAWPDEKCHRPTDADQLKFIMTFWTPQQGHKLVALGSCCTDEVINAEKKKQSSIDCWCCTGQILFLQANISVLKISFQISVKKNSNFERIFVNLGISFINYSFVYNLYFIYLKIILRKTKIASQIKCKSTILIWKGISSSKTMLIVILIKLHIHLILDLLFLYLPLELLGFLLFCVFYFYLSLHPFPILKMF